MPQNPNSCDLTLKIITPVGDVKEISCQSVRVNVSDNQRQKGGGSYGIRHGHAKAVLCLCEGEVACFTQGEKIFSARVSSGIAEIDSNTVTLLVDKIM